MLSWAQRRKFSVFLMLFIIAVLVFIFFAFKFYNQQSPLPIEARDINVLWSRLFQFREGFADVAVLLNNPNNISVQKIVYSFKIYDKNNILIAIKEGETFANPLERFVIFEPNIGISERSPQRVVFDLKEVVFSEKKEGSNPKVDILGTEEFFEEVFPRISVKIKNRENKSLENINATIVVFGKDQNVIAVSKTFMPFLAIGEEHLINFTWPKAFGEVFSTELFFR